MTMFLAISNLGASHDMIGLCGRIPGGHPKSPPEL